MIRRQPTSTRTTPPFPTTRLARPAVDADGAAAGFLPQPPHQPALAASEVEHTLRPPLGDRGDDRGVGAGHPAGDAAVANRADPQLGIRLPGPNEPLPRPTRRALRPCRFPGLPVPPAPRPAPVA